MAWIWWLLAPLASTTAGAVFLWWRSRREARRRTGGGRSSIETHRAMLAVLASHQRPAALPLTLVPVPEAAAEDQWPER